MTKETKMVASPAASRAQADFLRAFESFKSANDARLAEIERRGSADYLLTD